MTDAATIAAVPKIPPGMLDGIAKGIGEDFTFLQLDAILYRCAGERVILGYTNEKLPPWTIARNCLDGVEREGFTVVFLANLLLSLPETSPLYAKIVAAVPQAKVALPEVKAQLPDVIKGLETTRNLLSGIADPDARKALERSKATLEEVDRSIILLEAYKELHDCLHLLQIRQISSLLASTTSIAADPTQMAALREYKEQVRTSVQAARTIAAKLPNEPMLRAVEGKWIDDLDTSARFLDQALKDRNPAAAKVGIIRLSRVLQFQPPRLNDLIVASAKELPLLALSDALQKLGGSVREGAAELPAAAVALKNLNQAIRSHVAEHDMWQDIDKGIWVLEQVFSQSATQSDDFTAYWPEMKTRVRTMADLSPDSEWSHNIREDSDRIDLELLRLQKAAAAPSDPQAPSQLWSVFSDLRSEARFRFFVVDQQLKEDCGLLIGIGAPVQSILGMLSHD